VVEEVMVVVQLLLVVRVEEVIINLVVRVFLGKEILVVPEQEHQVIELVEVVEQELLELVKVDHLLLLVAMVFQLQ
jgi:hypothetical protein